MKILCISSTVFQIPVHGYAGLEHLAWQTAKGLAEKGHEVSIAAPDGSTCPGCTVIPFGPAGRTDERRAYQKYWKELVNFDCVIDHGWQKYSYILKAEGILKVPVLGVLHAPCHTMFQSPPPVDKPCIVCISEDQASHWKALHGNSDARVCRNGIDLDYYRPMAVKRTDRFLFLARFSTIKGPDLAVKAARQCDAGLDLVGDTSITQEPALFEEVKNGCDGKQIKMIGPATRGQTVFWFSQAHCMLHPNMRFREPLGLAPLEAQACGCPCIAWRYGAMPETISHGNTGYLSSNFEDFVVNMRVFNEKSDDDRRRMRENCLDWAQGFKLQNMIDRYHFICEEAVSTGGW